MYRIVSCIISYIIPSHIISHIRAMTQTIYTVKCVLNGNWTQWKPLYSPEDPNYKYLCEAEPAATETKKSFPCISVARKFQFLMDIKKIKETVGGLIRDAKQALCRTDWRKPGPDFIRVSPKHESQASPSDRNMLDTITDYHVAFIPLNGRLKAWKMCTKCHSYTLNGRYISTV